MLRYTKSEPQSQIPSERPSSGEIDDVSSSSHSSSNTSTESTTTNTSTSSEDTNSSSGDDNSTTNTQQLAEDQENDDVTTTTTTTRQMTQVTQVITRMTIEEEEVKKVDGEVGGQDKVMCEELDCILEIDSDDGGDLDENYSPPVEIDTEYLNRNLSYEHGTKDNKVFICFLVLFNIFCFSAGNILARRAMRNCQIGAYGGVVVMDRPLSPSPSEPCNAIMFMTEDTLPKYDFDCFKNKTMG